MFYFVTTRFFLKTSAIELAQVKRQNLFNELGVSSTIVEVEDDADKALIEKRLNISSPIINLYDYFQDLSAIPRSLEEILISEIFEGTEYKKTGDSYVATDNSIIVKVNNGRISYVDYLDRFGFTDRRDFYKQGKLSCSQFFADDAKLILSQYYDDEGKQVINKYYRGGPGRSEILVMIHLYHEGRNYTFKDESELIAFFLDLLVEADKLNGVPSTFLFDRSNNLLSALEMMSNPAQVYFVFHSLFADSGIVRDAYKSIPSLIATNKLQGLITSTKQEADDLVDIMHISPNKVWTIPVTYTSKAKPVSFLKRDPNKIIMVSRIATEKNVNDAIEAVIKVREKHPNAYLDIWGYGDDYNQNIALNSAKKLIEDNKAFDYIHLRGYIYDLSNEYDTSSVQLLTSHYEGFAMSLLEGQEHGVPAIAYDVTYGPNEIIEDGKSGYLVKHGHVDELVKRLDELLTNRKLRSEFSKEAYISAQNYSRKVLLGKWDNFIKEAKE